MNPRGLRATAPGPVATAKRKRLRWLLLAAAIIALTLAGTLGRAAFARWQHRRLIGDAAKAFAGGDLRSAALSARQAFLKNPASTAACAILAQIAEQEHSPEAILWRQHLVEIDPAKSPRLLDLAGTASALGETFVAEQALAQVAGRDRDTAAFHATAATVAVAAKQFGQAEKDFQRAAELDPKNQNVLLNLATIRLAIAPPGAATEAAATLERLRENPQFRHAALRALLTDARRRGDFARATGLAAELRQDAGSTLTDMLLWLDELQRAHSPEFDAQLRDLQSAAAKSEGTIYSIMTWMNARGLSPQTVAWADSLPPPIRSRIPVPLAFAEACMLTGDWKRLRTLVTVDDWGDVDFLRFAFHARVLDETAGHVRRAEFRGMWERATNATRGNTNALSMLARLVTGWGWKNEAAQLWWIIARNTTGQRPALQTLYAMHAADRNTRELYRVVRRIFEIEPSNPVAKNNVASLALLLGEDMPEAHRLAVENFRLDAAQPAFAATHALSLHRRNRTAEAVAVLEKLPAAAFEDPSLAACLGVLLHAVGDTAKAAPFLEKAALGKDKIFPEEITMVSKALGKKL